MATITNQPGQSWREAAIERSEGITDAWEVTKTYAGRLAEWILFACMIGCILEVLIAVPLWLSNTILGVQAVTLDIGGFALSSMADQARANGDEQAACKADVTGKFLISIVILTLALITVGLLYAPAKPYTDGAEKVLILIRVVMTVVYGHVIHSLRRTSAVALNPTQVANLETRMQEQVAQISATSSQAIANVQRSISGQVAHEVAQISASVRSIVADEVAQNLATLHDSVAQKSATIGENVAAQIAQLHSRLDDENAQKSLSGDQDTALLSEQVGQLVGLVNNQALIIEHLTNELAGVRREVRTTVTEIRSFAQEAPALPAAATAIVDASSEPGEKIRVFLQQWSSPKKPTIQAIMDACQVAKKTATRYRNEFYGLATDSSIGSQNDEEE